MSDGNFNRALLPQTPYRSGYKMGYEQARVRAVQALRASLQQHLPDLSPEQQAAIVADVSAAL